MELSFIGMRKNVRESKFWREDTDFGLGPSKFEVHIRHPSAKLGLCMWNLGKKLE